MALSWKVGTHTKSKCIMWHRAKTDMSCPWEGNQILGIRCLRHPPPHPPHPGQTSRTTRWRNNERYHPPPHPPHPGQQDDVTRNVTIPHPTHPIPDKHQGQQDDVTRNVTIPHPTHPIPDKQHQGQEDDTKTRNETAHGLLEALTPKTSHFFSWYQKMVFCLSLHLMNGSKKNEQQKYKKKNISNWLNILNLDYAKKLQIKLKIYFCHFFLSTNVQMFKWLFCPTDTGPSSCITATKSSSGSTWNTVWIAPPSPGEIWNTGVIPRKHHKNKKNENLVSRAQDVIISNHIYWIYHVYIYSSTYIVYIYMYHLYIYTVNHLISESKISLCVAKPEHCHGDGLSHRVGKALSYGHPHRYDPRCCRQLLESQRQAISLWYQKPL